MADFERARRQMVDCQIRPNDVTDYDIIEAFGAVPREIFLPQSKKPIAYIDADIRVENGDVADQDRYLMQVMPFAKMVQAAQIKPGDFVLCVGCGVGYGAAIVARLADSVIGLEENQSLLSRARDAVELLSIENLAIVEGKIEAGYPSEAPFDVILIEGSVDFVPDVLFGQLRDHGRLVTVVGKSLSASLCVYRRTGDDVSVMRLGNASVPMLPGFRREVSFSF